MLPGMILRSSEMKILEQIRMMVTDRPMPMPLNRVVKLCAIAGMAAIAMSAGYVLYFFYRVFCSVLLEQWKKLKDLGPQEVSVLSALTAVIIYFGVYPMSIVRIYQSVAGILQDILQV